MVDIRRPSNSGIRIPETGAFIHYVNGWEPQNSRIVVLGYWWDFLEVNPTARVEIPAVTVREFVTKYPSENGWRYQIISKWLMNGCVQFIELSQIWYSRLPYVVNIRDHVETTGWVSSSNGNPVSCTPGSSAVTGNWGARFYHSRVLQVHALPNVVSANISFTTGVRSVYCVILTVRFFRWG